MSGFAEDFREEIEDAYDFLLNEKKDALGDARLHGLSGIAEWIKTKSWSAIERALDSGDPETIDFACARLALAGLMLRDASRAYGKLVEDALACGDDALVNERLRAAARIHSRKPAGKAEVSS